MALNIWWKFSDFHVGHYRKRNIDKLMIWNWFSDWHNFLGYFFLKDKQNCSMIWNIFISKMSEVWIKRGFSSVKMLLHSVVVVSFSLRWFFLLAKSHWKWKGKTTGGKAPIRRGGGGIEVIGEPKTNASFDRPSVPFLWICQLNQIGRFIAIAVIFNVSDDLEMKGCIKKSN